MTTALDAAETKAVEARRVADAFSEQVKRRRRRWETITAVAAEYFDPAAAERAWADYQHAIAQYRAAGQQARRAEAAWAAIMKGGQHG